MSTYNTKIDKAQMDDMRSELALHYTDTHKIKLCLNNKDNIQEVLTFSKILITKLQNLFRKLVVRNQCTFIKRKDNHKK